MKGVFQNQVKIGMLHKEPQCIADTLHFFSETEK